MRYAGVSVPAVASDELVPDKIGVRDSPLKQGFDNPENDAKGHSDRGEAAAETVELSRTRHSGTERRRPPLNIGFIGHDFSEHPTAHMIEGVFVWHTRLANIGRKRKGIAGALETGTGPSTAGMRASDSANSVAAAASCR